MCDWIDSLNGPQSLISSKWKSCTHWNGFGQPCILRVIWLILAHGRESFCSFVHLPPFRVPRYRQTIYCKMQKNVLSADLFHHSFAQCKIEQTFRMEHPIKVQHGFIVAWLLWRVLWQSIHSPIDFLLADVKTMTTQAGVYWLAGGINWCSLGFCHASIWHKRMYGMDDLGKLTNFRAYQRVKLE